MRLAWIWSVLSLALAGCTGGAVKNPADDLGDLFVLATSPGNGAQLDLEDATDGFNALNRPGLQNPGAFTIVFSTSLDPASVLNVDPTDPQGTRNVRLFYFDLDQGPFDPAAPRDPGVNPPGAKVLLPAQTVLTTTHVANDTLIIRPTGISSTNPLREGQYSVIVEVGARAADGAGLRGREFFGFFRVGQDSLGPRVAESFPAPGQTNVAPDSEIRITFTETILASTVNDTNLRVTFQPAGAATALAIPGTWFADGGSGPGNHLPSLQLDANGRAGTTGVSPRNGADLVFRPDLDAFPVNMRAQDPTRCTTLTNDPPLKGNRGLPLGQAVTVTIETTGLGVTDTAGNPVPAGSPNTSFTFFTEPLPASTFSPSTPGAVYYGDTIGVGVIDLDPSRTPYLVGPNPARQPNSVVTAAGRVVRVAVPELVDITTDQRPWTSFYSFACGTTPRIFQGNVYALSKSGGGEVVVIDSYRMKPMGRFGTPSPGGIGITATSALGAPISARAVISNFSANTVSVYDISDVRWFTGTRLHGSQTALQNAVVAGTSQLILTEQDFTDLFPSQRQTLTSPPGPPLIGTVAVGVSPAAVDITPLPGALGTGGPASTQNLIVGVVHAGENTAAFTELVNLSQSAAAQPDLPGVVVSSRPLDIEWSPVSFATGAHYAVITGVGGTVELFSTGFRAGTPTVQAGSATTLAPNAIVNNLGGFEQPSSILWITNGNGTATNRGYSNAFLIAETGANRVAEVAITGENPQNVFTVVNTNLVAGLGPVDLTGDPAAVSFSLGAPRFTNYLAANAGEGTVKVASYVGGVIATDIPVPGVLMAASWWSR